MASRLDQFQEFVLTFQSPWNLAGAGFHKWHQSFYVSGTIQHTDADAETAGLALAAPALALASSKTSLIGITYYASGSLIATSTKVYAAGTHAGNGTAYAAGSVASQQLEVAAVAHAPIGKNTRGKEIYLRKYFHEVVGLSGDPNTLESLNSASALLAPFNTGAGPHAVVPVSPSSGKSGVWTMETHLYTHQLRKGKKRKKLAPAGTSAPSIADLLGLGLTAGQAALFIAKYFPK